MNDHTSTNWFDSVGDIYAQYRLQYPPQLAQDISALASGHGCAVDVGCGTGQLSTLLANHFERVIALDSSAEQIRHARRHAGVDYVLGSAESLPLEPNVADLVTCAQSVHWFDLVRFFAEVNRIARPGAAVILMCYGSPRLSSETCDTLLQELHWTQAEAFWPPQTRLIDEHYRTVAFPFDEIDIAPMNIDQDISRSELLGFISTWSATRAMEQAGRLDILRNFGTALARAWPEGDQPLRATWTIYFRAGRIPKPQTSADK